MRWPLALTICIGLIILAWYYVPHMLYSAEQIRWSNHLEAEKLGVD